MKSGVADINARVQSLAPVLNTPSLDGVVTVTSASPVDAMTKQQGGSLYVFAIGMTSGSADASFAVPEGSGATVLGEDRSLKVESGAFSDTFDGYAVHLYRID